MGITARSTGCIGSTRAAASTSPCRRWRTGSPASQTRAFNGHVAAAGEVGCWAHGRRRLVAQQDVDCRVAYPLKLIARLYRIEHLADAQQLSVGERTTLRQERARPVLDTLQRWRVITHRDEPPSSELAKASGYLLNHWEALTRFVDDGRLSLDNNLTDAASGITERMPRPGLCRIRVRKRVVVTDHGD